MARPSKFDRLRALAAAAPPKVDMAATTKYQPSAVSVDELFRRFVAKQVRSLRRDMPY